MTNPCPAIRSGASAFSLATRMTCLAVATAVVLGSLSGCATQRSATSGAASDGGSGLSGMCSPAIVGLAAGLVCAALPVGRDRARAAAVCAAAAVLACYLVNSYRSERARNAQQVQDEYLQRNTRLPERATVTAYQSNLSPGTMVRRGQELQLLSTIVAVPGRNDRNIVIEEEIAVFDATGERWGKPVRKLANSGKEAGEYRTSFTIPIVDSMSQGVYVFKRSLYVNGTAVMRDDQSAQFQVVQADGDAPVLASLR